MRGQFLLFYFSIIIIGLLIFNVAGCKSSNKSLNQENIYKSDSSSFVDSKEFSGEIGSDVFVDSSESFIISDSFSKGGVGSGSKKNTIVMLEGDFKDVEIDSSVSIIKGVSDKNDIDIVDGLGVIAYNVPDTMQIGREYIVKLRISKKYSKSLTIGLVDNSGDLVVSDIRVGNTMEVKLIETNSSVGSFSITSLSSGIQSIENDSSYTTWEWSVRPVKGGLHKLKMVVVIKGENFTKDIPVYEDEIYIQNSYIFVINNFVSKNWQWLCGSIIIPLIVFLWKRREEKKDNKNS